ncbi:MAG: hypothetical protein Q4E33_02260, partial [Erysipelotrichaceae bacterium]|nr:hypothetical protein [Erysipelotrichaceae bacterium]
LFSITLTVLMSLSMIGVNVLTSEEEPSGSYTVTIPANVPIDIETGEGSFDISCSYGEGFDSIDISITSINGYKLLSEQGQELTYKFLDSALSEITDNPYIITHDNIKGTSGSFVSSFSIQLTNSYKFAGNYKDTLTFEIEVNPYYTEELSSSSETEYIEESQIVEETPIIEEPTIEEEEIPNEEDSKQEEELPEQEIIEEETKEEEVVPEVIENEEKAND